MALLRSIVTIGGLTMVSRVLGFIRDMLIAAVLGAGPVADAFFVAFRLPNLFRALFAEGAFSAAFVPLFARSVEAEGEGRAAAFAEQALSVLLSALLVFLVVFEIAMPLLIYVIAPGFGDSPAQVDLAIQFARINFPYLLFISLVSLMAGILNSLGRFAAAAATPILLNVAMIAAALMLVPWTPTPGHALAWGVAAAGVLQFLWLFYFCGRAGLWLRLPRPRLTPEVRLLVRRALPVALGAGIYQVNLTINTALASWLPAGSVSYLFYADRVNQLPLGIVGIAVGTALLPLLSRQLRAGHGPAAMHSQNRALEFTLLLTVPAAVALIVLATPIMSVLFERGAFGPAEAEATATALAAYAFGLPAYVLIKALAPGFFAREDTRTPVKVAAASAAINVGLNLVLMWPFSFVGIAASTAIASWINALALAAILWQRGHLRVDERLRRRLPRVLGASAIMGGVCAALHLLVLGPWLAGHQAHRVVALAILVGVGLATFALSAQLFGAAGVQDLRGLLKGRGIEGSDTA
ncbi:MAG: murein biosynthesis integral membrane protein MurJ [Rhodospirillales bacterium]|nr:murein biosynthesis integral membrane protein MurJ [Rhodospirillales bacterium]